jgi:hypothetical protein
MEVDSDTEENSDMEGNALPSWVPDWRAGNLTTRLIRQGQDFTASQGSKPSYDREGGSDILHFDGFIFDKVKTILYLPFPPDIGSSLRSNQATLAGIGGIYRSGEAIETVLRRVWRAENESTFEDDFLGTSDEPQCAKPEEYNKPVTGEDIGWIAENLLLGTATVKGELGRKIVATSNEYLALVPKEAKEGDLVCILMGGKTPFVLRSAGDYYQIVGSCYVDGIMNGEAMSMLDTEKVLLQRFSIQ